MTDIHESFQAGFRRWFTEIKNTADTAADGNVATLIESGINELESRGFDTRTSQFAVPRAAYWANREFTETDWRYVQEYVNIFKDADPQTIQTAFREAAEHRIRDMNHDLLEWAKQAEDDDWVPPPDDLRPWADHMLRTVGDICEQPLKFYLGLLIAVAKTKDDSPAPTFGTTQAHPWTIGKLLDHPTSKRCGTSRLGASRKMRNASAHRDFTINDGCIESQSEIWTPEVMLAERDVLLRVVGALSLGAAIGAGKHYTIPGDEQRLEDSYDDFTLIADFWACWMEWTQVTATRQDQILLVEAWSDGPIRFGNLMHAAGHCNAFEDVRQVVCRIEHGIAGGGPLVIQIPIFPQGDDPDESTIAETVKRATIDDAPIVDPEGYGGIERLAKDRRFRDVDMSDEQADETAQSALVLPVRVLYLPRLRPIWIPNVP